MRLGKVVFAVGMLLALAGAAVAKAQVIAHVGRTLTVTDAYLTKDMYGSPDFRIPYDTKVVVLSHGSGVARLLMGSGDEVFVPLYQIDVLAPVTLKQANAKIRYFERMKDNDPFNADYYDQLAAPWVALVVREIGRKAKEGLPDPVAVYEYEEAPPTLKVENSTKYKLRIYLTGPKTITRLVPAYETWSEQMPAGSYRVLAEATAGKVIPLRTTWRLKQGYTHSIMLYIRTERVYR